MRQELENYAKILDHIGNQINLVSESLVGIDSGNLLLDRTVNEQKLKYGLRLYSECRAMLFNIAIPKGIDELHLQLVDAIDEWLKGTTQMVEGINTDKDMIVDGYIIQKQGLLKIQVICTLIGDKVLSLYREN